MKAAFSLLLCLSAVAGPPSPPGLMTNAPPKLPTNMTNVLHNVSVEYEVRVITYHSFVVGTNTFKVATSTNLVGKYLNWSVPTKQ